MSITTKGGDDGETDLLFGRRVSKSHPRVLACGAVDELNAALGLARAAGPRDPATGGRVAAIQRELIVLMGELATDSADLDRHAKAGFAPVTASMVEALGEGARELEDALEGRFKGWAIPGEGASLCAAHLDLARTVARRAEREVVGLLEVDPALNREPLRYLNRLSDYLWLLARHEGAPGPDAGASK